MSEQELGSIEAEINNMEANDAQGDIDELAKAELIAANKAADNAPEILDPLETKEVQIAAGQFAQNMKRIRSLAKNLKAGQIARVLIAEAEFPFAMEYPKLKGVENELFVLMVSNNKAKSVIAEALKPQEEALRQMAANNETNNILERGGL
jgi:hypothetical protein